jgi:hypothetical protein
LVHEYKYKKGKLKDALYDNNIVTSYGDGRYNLFYNVQGQVIKLDNLQEHISAIYDYNSRGRIIEKQIEKSAGSNPDEHPYVNTLIEYNDKNDIEKKFTKYTTQIKKDTSFLVNMYKYEYDSKGNWVECSHLGGGNATFTHRRIYYHDGTYSGDSLSEEDSKRIYHLSEVDIPPLLPERKESILEYMIKNVYFGKVVRRVDEGNIRVTMVVSDTGEVSYIKILKEPDFDYTDTDNVLPVIPKGCIPARKNGKNVNAYLEFTVGFKRTL